MEGVATDIISIISDTLDQATFTVKTPVQLQYSQPSLSVRKGGKRRMLLSSLPISLAAI